MTGYRAHNADRGDWHEIVGESGEAGEGCLITVVKAIGWAILAGAASATMIMAFGYTALRWDLW